MIPSWALALSYWLHMLATVAWVGGLSALVLIILPAARKTLDAPSLAAFLDAVQRRLDPLGWFSLALLTVSGLIQMSANVNYQGFLTVQNSWARAILLKHLFIGGMILSSAWLTWGVLPEMRRMALLRLRGQDNPAEEERLRKKENLLLQLNFGLAVLVLLLTALARAA